MGMTPVATVVCSTGAPHRAQRPPSGVWLPQRGQTIRAKLLKRRRLCLFYTQLPSHKLANRPPIWLFVPQRANGVDSDRSAGRNPAGQGSDGEEEDGDAS